MDRSSYFTESYARLTRACSKDHFLAFLVLILSIQLLLRFSVSLHGYSGEKNPPRFGDYEAQRHWMEITTALDINSWYRQTEVNDLQWWGLDYPPLTAYHSWLCGKISAWFEPASMVPVASRGYETPTHRVFMRSTAIVSELLIYITGLYYFVKTRYPKDQLGLFFIMLLQPPLMIIDHGHFQYNAVSLGFVLWGIAFLCNDRDLLGSIAFSLALNYKQMALYFAPAFFFYLIGKSIHKHTKFGVILHIGQIGTVVIATFVICWLPFILEGKDGVLTVLGRIFPLHRGLYEDKVANFWCSVAPVIKFKELFAVPFLVKLCAGTTLSMLLPSCFNVLRNPTHLNFIWTCLICSFSFFLFSFHVHEKSILFPMLPLTLLIPEIPQWALWLTLVSNFSMFPLIIQDGTVIPYIFCSIAFLIVGLFALRTHNTLTLLGVTCMVGIHLIHLFMTPPARLPHLFIICFTTFAFVNFAIFFIYANWTQWRTKLDKQKVE